MEIYVSEKERVKDIAELLYNSTDENRGGLNSEFNAEVKSLEQHDKELLREFVSQIVKSLSCMFKYTPDKIDFIETKINEILKERGIYETL